MGTTSSILRRLALIGLAAGGFALNAPAVSAQSCGPGTSAGTTAQGVSCYTTGSTVTANGGGFYFGQNLAEVEAVAAQGGGTATDGGGFYFVMLPAGTYTLGSGVTAGLGVGDGSTATGGFAGWPEWSSAFITPGDGTPPVYEDVLTEAAGTALDTTTLWAISVASVIWAVCVTWLAVKLVPRLLRFLAARLHS